jgi:hypothetical protein
MSGNGTWRLSVMSQQMEFNEANQQQQQEPPFDSYQSGYHDPFMNSYTPGLKLSSYSSGASSKQRLALAIVSVCLLVPISAIVLGISTAGGSIGLFLGFITLGVLGLIILGINLAFNLAKH